MLIRPPHVAGSFYPSDPSELHDFCASHLKSSGPGLAARAVILPHAGYFYSGQTACLVLSKVKVPNTVLMIGPNHRGVGSEFAIYASGQWQTPLGNVSVASGLAAALLEANHDLHLDEMAHAGEHSLEVLLPFLQICNPRAAIVPLIIGTLDFEEVGRVARDIGEILKSRSEKILVAISNDMSHYETDEATRKKDKYALDAILALDAGALLRAARQHRITMCGIAPVYMLLCMKEAFGITRAQLVDYRTSADASGDKSRVVGYAGFLFE